MWRFGPAEKNLESAQFFVIKDAHHFAGSTLVVRRERDGELSRPAA